MKDTLSTQPAGLLCGNAAVQVSKIDVGARLSLRAKSDIEALGGAFGLALPTKIGTRTATEAVEALCLGPDEWVLLAKDAAPLFEASASLYDKVPHSLVDISAREVTFEISGPRATDLITIGCPRDPASISLGEARRTVMDGTSVVLWRDDENSYCVDVWNSFAPHLLHLLETGCRELAAESLVH